MHYPIAPVVLRAFSLCSVHLSPVFPIVSIICACQSLCDMSICDDKPHAYASQELEGRWWCCGSVATDQSEHNQRKYGCHGSHRVAEGNAAFTDTYITCKTRSAKLTPKVDSINYTSPVVSGCFSLLPLLTIPHSQ